MPKLTDDPKVAEALAKAEARGANTERKRINTLIQEASSNPDADKASKAALRDLKKQIRETA